MSSTYKPKLSIELTQSQQDALRAIPLNHGWQRAVFSRIVDDIISITADLGVTPLALIIGDQLRPKDILPSITKSIEHTNKLLKD